MGLRRSRSKVLDSACQPHRSPKLGKADTASDVDFLVELEPGRSLFDLGGLLVGLREHLPCEVDVMTPAMLKPRAREQVLREAVPL